MGDSLHITRCILLAVHVAGCAHSHWLCTTLAVYITRSTSLAAYHLLCTSLAASRWLCTSLAASHTGSAFHWLCISLTSSFNSLEHRSAFAINIFWLLYFLFYNLNMYSDEATFWFGAVLAGSIITTAVIAPFASHVFTKEDSCVDLQQ